MAARPAGQTSAIRRQLMMRQTNPASGPYAARVAGDRLNTYRNVGRITVPKASKSGKKFAGSTGEAEFFEASGMSLARVGLLTSSAHRWGRATSSIY
ncbi:MAG: hypothetical protein WCC04_18825 [Terriglobales bacterium]